ncbi:DUF748 domain-containing protein [Pelagicoccus sp. SDUM812003]|uniref:DUF748 domain-containing protein n=1 Tax=Pelagicoccus sp. SDUM812003 TaxID=3041267 RepID=UPI00280FE5E5|nr:DUF748 domain-containing protein [Pelagicoccus sp. SDUM812003]MDQ8203083.1 DUF748 domain-containing protein [Pelagicoccus sp. SDUM812003]
MSASFLVKRPWLKRVIVTALVLFSLYLCFGIWGVPAILKSQLERRGPAMLGREVAVEKASFNPLTLETRLYGLQVSGDGEPLLEVGRASVNPQIVSVFGQIEIKSVELSDVTARVAITEGGSMSFDDVLASLSEMSGEEEQTEPSGEPMRIRISDTDIRNVTIHFRDLSLEAPYEETLVLESLTGANLGTVPMKELETEGVGGDGSAYHWTFDALLRIASGGSLQMEGGALSLEPWSLSVSSSLQGVQLSSLQPYVSETMLAELAGEAGFDLAVDVTMAAEGETAPEIVVTGEARLGRFSLRDESKEHLRFQSLSLSGLMARLSSMEIEIARIGLLDPFLDLTLSEEGTPVLPQMKTSTAATASSSGAGGQAGNLSLKLAEFNAEGGAARFEDRSLESSFSTEFRDIEISIREISAMMRGEELSASALAQVDLSAFDGSLSLSGALASLEEGGDFSVSANGLDVSQFQPYVSEAANALLEKGRIRFDATGSFDLKGSITVTSNADLTDLQVAHLDEERQFFNLASLSIKSARFDGKELAVAEVEVVDPGLSVWQDEEDLNLYRIEKRIQEDFEKQVEVARETTGEEDLSVRLDRFLVRGGGLNFSDSTLVSTLRTRLTDFELLVENLSTDPLQVANFSISTEVDEGGRMKGEGAFQLADPEAQSDLSLTVNGFDMTAISPYWETYLGRKLAKGQFEIVSTYKIRNSQLEGTNSFRIDQLTLGDRVESSEAINLPVGFAISLLKDPSGMISYDGLRVSGDLSSPNVSIGGLILQTFGNLVLKAATSPFKFLAGMVGGSEDLDTIHFDPGSIAISGETRSKVDSLVKILNQRPALRLELIENTKMDEESAYLKKRYARHVLANPDFEPNSVVDLLADYDQSAFQAGLELSYDQLKEQEAQQQIADSRSEIETEQPEVNPKSKADADEALKTREKVNLLTRLARLIGLKRGDDSQKSDQADSGVAQASEAVSAKAEPTSEAPEPTEEPEPTAEEKFAYVLERLDRLELDPEWIRQLGHERMLAVKKALTDDGEIESSRIFIADTAAGDGAMSKSADLVLKLTD